MKKYIVGIDEVGRGPLAGPVTVCAFAVPKGLRVALKDVPLRDSKQLTEIQRKVWHMYLKKHPLVRFAICHVQPSVIDRINIREAANLAATRALLRLGDLRVVAKILLDGGLYLNLKEKRVRTVVGGDEKYICIRLASIVAKVRRDALMDRLHKKYPQYGFHIHKGYGTKAHVKAIKKNGASQVHRKSFLKKMCV